MWLTRNRPTYYDILREVLSLKHCSQPGELKGACCCRTCVVCCWYRMSLSPFFICAHTAALWRCVFVHVWKWNRFFVCLNDGAMMVTHPWFVCIWECERRREPETHPQHINKDMVSHENSVVRRCTAGKMNRRLKMWHEHIWGASGYCDQRKKKTIFACVSHLSEVEHTDSVAVLLTLRFVSLPASRPVVSRSTSSRDKDMQFTVSLQWKKPAPPPGLLWNVKKVQQSACSF